MLLVNRVKEVSGTYFRGKLEVPRANRGTALCDRPIVELLDSCQVPVTVEHEQLIHVVQRWQSLEHQAIEATS